jgi:hypothetical protein
MKPHFFNPLLAAVSLTLVSCSSTTYGPLDEKSQGVSYQKGVPGATIVETHKLTATVTAVDGPNRKVTLLGQDGKTTTLKCGPDVLNFDQIHVGNIVKATVTAELTVAMANAATAPADSTTTLVALAPKGAKPGAVMAETQHYTATVTAINLKRHQATLRFPDGSTRTFTVREDVDLTQRKVGEEVAFRVVVAVAIALEKRH